MSERERTDCPQLHRKGYYRVGVHKGWTAKTDAPLRVQWCKKPCDKKCDIAILSHDDSSFILFSIGGRVQVWCTSRKQYRAQRLTPTASRSSEFCML